MLSDACFVVAEALNVAGVLPSAVERALNAFANAMDSSNGSVACEPAILRALRQGSVAVNRGALLPRTFGEMAAAVQRHLDGTDTLTDTQLVRVLDKWNRTARQHLRTPPLVSVVELIAIRDVVDVLAERGGSVYPHALKTGLSNRFPAASVQEVDTAYERALACYALTITPMGKVCRVPRDSARTLIDAHAFNSKCARTHGVFLANFGYANYVTIKVTQARCTAVLH